ncbi:hypothetical protein ACQUWQ_21515, partial [Ralstonia pseudosolanacearum]|uniref:hypothetical protein n=1 Tax=Ralstonia pseudosolanacearum TaxID=1310165 RepID=UPI003D18224A
MSPEKQKRPSGCLAFHAECLVPGVGLSSLLGKQPEKRGIGRKGASYSHLRPTKGARSTVKLGLLA